MDGEPSIGWNEDPEQPDRYRYWDGSRWTGHATVSEGGRVASLGISWPTTRRSRLRRAILRNTVVLHTLAWFDCSVPVTKGRLRRFTWAPEQRAFDELMKLRRAP